MTVGPSGLPRRMPYVTLVTPDTPRGPTYPLQPLHHLDQVWIQVAGTLCNLSCRHCFVPSGPGIERHALMPRESVRAHVAEALALGAKEFYFTGGEPFVHPEMIEILADTLADAPATVLTNGTLFTRRLLERLRGLAGASRFALEIRVSLDGPDAASHDAFRGGGSFARTLEGLRACEAHGLLPIVTVTRQADEPALALRARYVAMLRASGIARPRLKLLPMFRLGREADRSGGYAASESLAGVATDEIAAATLQCGSCRAVTSRGVFVCPLLVDEPAARMGATFADALGPFELRHGACLTCHVTGMTCANG